MRWWLLASWIPSVAFAVPLELSQSARVLDPSGLPVEGDVVLEVRLFDAEDGGRVVFTEEVPVTLQQGFYTVFFGPGGSPTLDSALFDEQTLYLQVALDGQALSDRQRLVSVPYAVASSQADTADRALSADTADRATLADRATQADSATVADRATQADSATRADRADEADTATTAGTATFSDRARLADTATVADRAAVADNADFATSAASADSASTAQTATALSGGPVNATQVSVNGTLVIDSNGNLVGPATSGSGAYTVWGRNSCPSGSTRHYAGIISAYGGVGGGGGNFCLDNAAPSGGWVDWGDGLLVRSVAAGSGLRSQYTNSGTATCAVCAGDAWTRYGSANCPSGTSEIYDGYIAQLMVAWGGNWSGGDVFCLDDSFSTSWINWDSALLVRARAGGSGGNRVEYQNTTSVRCAVCR